MIFPWIRGFINWSKAPLTWTIIFLNVIFYLITWDYIRLEKSYFNGDDDLIYLGKVYFEFKNPGEELPAQSQKQWLLLANKSLRDPNFLENFSLGSYFGDQVAIEHTFSELKKYHQDVKDRWTSLFGLNTYSSEPIHWITYQFMHASWMHLFGNMVMVLIFCGALEIMIGSMALLGIYLLSGFTGAWFFILLNPITLSPMVGASGAISGIIAFYAVFEIKKRVPFIYFVSPLQGYFGQIYLPTLMLFPLIFLPDVAGLLASSEDFGNSVAYAAHIGGALFGIVSGLIFRKWRKTTSLRWLFAH